LLDKYPLLAYIIHINDNERRCDMKKQLGRKLNFYISPKLEKKLKEYAEKKGWKFSFVIREAIKEFLDKKSEVRK